MSAWDLQYWSDDTGKKSVENWLDSLTKEELKAVAKKLKLLAACGNTLKMPHSRPLKKGLFELRDKAHGFRIYYAFERGKLIILLAAGDKSTQEKDIKAARERLKETIRKQEEK